MTNYKEILRLHSLGINNRNGVHTIEAAAALGYGSREYTLVEVD